MDTTLTTTTNTLTIEGEVRALLHEQWEVGYPADYRAAVAAAEAEREAAWLEYAC